MIKSIQIALGVTECRYGAFSTAIVEAMLLNLQEPTPALVKSKTIQDVMEQQTPDLTEAALIGLMVEQAYNGAVAQIKKRHWPFR